jgi:hypothetical protein
MLSRFMLLPFLIKESMGLSPVDRLISQGKVEVQKFGKITGEGFFPRAIVIVGGLIHLVMILAKSDRLFPIKKNAIAPVF